MNISLPPVLALDESWNGNPIRQLRRPADSLMADAANYTSPPLKGKLILPDGDASRRILVVERRYDAIENFDEVIQAKLDSFDGGDGVDLSVAKWLRYPGMPKPDGGSVDYGHLTRTVIDSWRGAFSYLEEDPSR